MIASTVEVLCALPTGTLVRLPDGELAVVNWSSHAEVHVVQPQRVLGRGPWIFARWQVEPVTATEVNADVMQRAAEWRAL